MRPRVRAHRRSAGPPGPARSRSGGQASRRGVLAALVSAGALALGGTGVAAASTVHAPRSTHAGGPTGTVTMCNGFGLPPGALEGFNAKYREQGLRLRVVDVSGGGDPYDALEALLRRHSRECDLFYLDVDFVGEFAGPGWIVDMGSVIGPRRRAQFIRSTLTTARYRHRYVAAPASTDAGLLYYRTDRVAAVPATWQGVYDSARAHGGIVYQGGAYEGLTCDWLEISFAAGGSLLTSDGRRSAIDSPQNLRALRFMVDGLRTGATPTIVATFFDEFASTSAFFTGGPAYMRNWPYAWSVGQDTNFADRFSVAALPKFAGGGRGGVLGGLDLAISRYARNARGAARVVDYLTSPEAQRLGADPAVGLWPVRKDTYDEPAIRAAVPFAAILKGSIAISHARPVTPKYHDISAAVYDNVHAALHGDVSPEEALQAAQRQINEVLSAR